MKLIVGLGNPGQKYQTSRHNAGYIILDHLLQKLESKDKTFWENAPKFKAEVKKVVINDQEVTLLKPLTFMNNSGEAVQKYAAFFKIVPQDICIIHDDLDMPLGKIRIRFGGGSGGNNGVESIIEKLGTDKFLRIRLGIGRDSTDNTRADKTRVVSDYVLGNFTSREKGKMNSMIKQAIKDVFLICEHGIDLYMSKYNK